jgi:hypothetical protein
MTDIQASVVTQGSEGQREDLIHEIVPRAPTQSSHYPLLLNYYIKITHFILEGNRAY